MKRNLLVIICLLMFVSMQTKAQWECPSRLSASLKPIGSSDVMWAAELTTTGGVLGNYYITNAMGYLGLDYTKNRHTLYFEGGEKFWYRFDSTGYSNQLAIPGAREAFYRYKSNVSNLTLGLQSTKSDDYYLVNERMLGLNYRFTKDAWKFNIIGGSVMKEFARNGTFCTLGYLYNVIPRRDRAILGNQPGQTNLTMFTLAYMPTKRKKASSDEFAISTDASVGDEFSSEFSSDVAEKKPAPKFKCESIGIVGYDEFGSWIDNNAFLGGLYTELDLFQVLTLKPEILYQYSLNNNAILYHVTAEKQFNWNKGGQMTKIFARYIGIDPQDKSAIARNSFSNVFAGEVIRLDALELPLFQAGLKHSFPKAKTSIKLQMAQQVGQGSLTETDIALGKKGKKMSEYDMVISKNFGKYLLINATVGYLNYYYLAHNHNDTTPQEYLDPDFYTDKSDFFAKIELRLTF